MSDNLNLYNQVRKVPQEAQKPITGGRLKGKTDINPMWRIKALTEQFGLCGIGWKYIITKQWVEEGSNGEKAAFVNIELYIKDPGIKTGAPWSDPIPGTGGSSFVAKESSGLYTSDECFKMALTDAISVSCKALGFGADVYWEKDSTKYSGTSQTPRNDQTKYLGASQTPRNGQKQGQGTNTPTTGKAPNSGQTSGSASGETVYTCTDCGEEITQGVHAYSTNKLGRPLCGGCQNKIKKQNQAS